MALKINNRTARRLWLQSQGLAKAPVGQSDVMGIIRRLGFVQMDTIRNVVRAHDHILWSRNQSYREGGLEVLLAAGEVFEHFTHDASCIPIEVYPYWQRQFRRYADKMANQSYYKTAMKAADVAAILERVRAEGPLSTHAFDTKAKPKKGVWSRPPHKVELDKMWYSGVLATSHRKDFTKFYDLAERVIPADLREMVHSDEVQVDWLCRAALARLGFGTVGDIQRFWGAMSAAEAKAWVANARLVPVKVQARDGSWREGYALQDIEARVAAVAAPTSRLRIINPFDPVARDRERLASLFGFDYRIEIFVPAAKRKWGYYVYPLLEGDRFVGRIDMKADRANGALMVKQIWWEAGVRASAARIARLEAEVGRMARFVGMDDIQWNCAAFGVAPGARP